MHVLLQNQATRDAILAAMQKYLVDEPASGDIVVFYYAGHGSLRYNSKSTKRSNHSITRLCLPTHIPELRCARSRDRTHFNAALDKGVKLTAIFDSCHSGTIARGIPLVRKARSDISLRSAGHQTEGPD